MPVSTSVLVRMYLENMREEQLIVGAKYLVGFKKGLKLCLKLKIRKTKRIQLVLWF